MTRYEAPAKLNLSLHVMPPTEGGYHPLDSMVQTVEWFDELSVESGEGSDALVVEGAEIDPDDNLVAKAISEARKERRFEPLDVKLVKRLPIGSGLGGGSSDAAAALAAIREIVGGGDWVSAVARRVGADVSLFLTGGTLRMTGFGEEIEPMRPLAGFALAIAVPEFGLATAAVYKRWDSMEGPHGEPVPDDLLPPALRGGMPMRNDLLPAALDIEPLLGDFMADLRAAWAAPVSLTGSGSGCFGYFPSIDEAEDAAQGVSDLCAVSLGVELRGHGVSRV